MCWIFFFLRWAIKYSSLIRWWVFLTLWAEYMPCALVECRSSCGCIWKLLRGDGVSWRWINPHLWWLQRETIAVNYSQHFTHVSPMSLLVSSKREPGSKLTSTQHQGRAHHGEWNRKKLLVNVESQYNLSWKVPLGVVYFLLKAGATCS